MICLRPQFALICVAFLLVAGCAQDADEHDEPSVPTFSNPIIPGFAPDPSIVRVGDDFYLINSTFEYFPGIPVYHSRDLVNWELISYAIHEPTQAELSGIKSSDGIHASTIRHYDGLFYVITTNNVAGNMVNFIITASDPRGPWSAPHVVEGAPGIDPSLFFGDDGRAWYVGNHMPPDPEFDGQAEIWLQELDLDSMQLIGERHYLWRGCCGGVWAEGPHIYKKDGYYYLLISEGGTAYEHALAVAISENITGPYQNNPRNPVLTHRQLSYDFPITGVGHADLVELQDGRWYAVALGWRLIDGRHGILGRETFLVPVVWETEHYWWKEEKLTFPVFSPSTGRVELHYPVPFAGTSQQQSGAFVDEFDGPVLGLEWNLRRAPAQDFYSLTDNEGSLRLRLQQGAIAEREQYSFVGVRQREFEFEAVTQVTFSPSAGEEAGLVVIQNDKSAYLLTLNENDAGNELRLVQSLYGEVAELASQHFDSDTVFLKVKGTYLDYSFYYSLDGENWHVIKTGVDGTALSPYFLKGYNYTGAYVGLYASANGQATDNYADFESFIYLPKVDTKDDWYFRQEVQQNSN
jgi:alpha-N-arabinofuranosidase